MDLHNSFSELYEIKHNGSQKVLRHLQKGFTTLQYCLKDWKDVMSKSEDHISSIQNLAEQHHCSAAAQELQEITKKFPDVPQKLLYKIDMEINNHLLELQSLAKKLKEICDKVTKQADISQDTFDRQSFDIEMMTRRSATCPSIIEMLEWLQDSEKNLRDQYFIKKHLLDQFSLSKQSCEDALYQKWNLGEKDMISTIEGHFAFVGFFLDVKLTT